MFHSARGILFADGFRKKSHFAVSRYLEDRYARMGLIEMKWIDLLDHYRETRHDNQYSTTFFITEEDARKALKSAMAFVNRVYGLMEQVY